MKNTGQDMTKIKSFLYLDYEKLKSHSSQIFEGVTEYVSKNESEIIESVEQQKGPVGSGLILGNILRKDKTSAESRFLEDYAYSLFEEKASN